MSPRIGSVSLGERYVTSARLWMHASMEFPSRYVQIYVRRQLTDSHMKIVEPGLTLEILEQISELMRHYVFASTTCGDITLEVGDLLRELRREDSPS